MTIKLQREHQPQGTKLGMSSLAPTIPKAVSAGNTGRSASEGRLPLLPTIHRHVSEVDLIRAERTASQYGRDLREFADECGKIFLDEFDRRDVQAYIARMVKRGRKPKTIHNRLTTLKAFFRKYGQDGSIVNFADAPRIHRKIPHTYTRERSARSWLRHVCTTA